MENQVDPPALSTPPISAPPPVRTARRLAILAGCALLFAGAYGVIRWSMNNGQAAVDPPKDAPPQKHFVGWKKPDFALIITGQSFGYLQPCGCSDPQYGGLARRWEFINSLKQKGWPVVPVDLGDIYPKNSDTPAQQNLLKYETAMRALHVMGYHAVGIGKQELGVPLTNALVQFSAQNNPRPRPLAANLAGVEANGVYHELNARAYEVVKTDALPKIGIVGMIGKTVQDAFKDDANLKFAAHQMKAALKDLANEKTEFNIGLIQTDEKFQPNVESELDKCVTWCQEQKQTSLNVVIYSSDDPEPPSIPRDLNGTQLISIGHKGRYVGVLGVWDNKGKYEYKYEMVLIGPEFAPQPGNPVSALMEEYTVKVMKQGLMAKFPYTSHTTQIVLRGKNIETKYIGSEICADCHDGAHKIWEGTAHAHATDTLEKRAKDPGLRQFDGECMQCHTTGFKNATGFNDLDSKLKLDPKLNPKAAALKKQLNGVGCESCHGPASAHVNDPNNLGIRKLINPWAKHFNQGIPENTRQTRINTFCQSCHDIDNDVHWDFAKRWPGVEHMNPAKESACEEEEEMIPALPEFAVAI